MRKLLQQLTEIANMITEAYGYSNYIVTPEGNIKWVAYHGDILKDKNFKRQHKAMVDKINKMYGKKLEDAIIRGDSKLYDIMIKEGIVRMGFLHNTEVFLSFDKPPFKALIKIIELLKEKNIKVISQVDTPNKYKENITLDEFVELFL